jgi:periplasmic protein CpxP/Spy
MRTLGIVLVGFVLILPGLAAGQTVPLPATPDGDTGPPPIVLVQGPGGFPPPMPGEQRPGGPGGPAPLGPLPPERMVGPNPGVWWKDSEAVKKLALTEAQVGQIEQIFLAHRLRLVDLRADLEKHELNLQPLLDADRPDETKVAAQIDLITAARGRLEKEHALMLLATRRVLSTDQWKRLQALQQERAKGVHGGPPMAPPGGPGSAPGRPPAPPPPR